MEGRVETKGRKERMTGQRWNERQKVAHERPKVKGKENSNVKRKENNNEQKARTDGRRELQRKEDSNKYEARGETTWRR